MSNMKPKIKDTLEILGYIAIYVLTLFFAK